MGVQTQLTIATEILVIFLLAVMYAVATKSSRGIFKLISSIFIFFLSVGAIIGVAVLLAG